MQLRVKMRGRARKKTASVVGEPRPTAACGASVPASAAAITAMSALCRRVNRVPTCCPRRYTKANLRAHIQHCAQAIAADEQAFRKLPSRQLKNREVKTITRINAQNATNGSHRVVVKNSKDRGMGGVGRCLGGIGHPAAHMRKILSSIGRRGLPRRKAGQRGCSSSVEALTAENT